MKNKMIVNKEKLVNQYVPVPNQGFMYDVGYAFVDGMAYFISNT